MARAAPRLPWQLVRALGRLDDPRRPVAETWRRAGALADELGVPRPSYEQVRRLVERERALRAVPGSAGLAAEVVLRARGPEQAARLAHDRWQERRTRLEEIRQERHWRPTGGKEQDDRPAGPDERS